MTLREQIDKLHAEKVQAIEANDRETFQRINTELRRLEPLRGKLHTAPTNVAAHS